MSRTRRTGQNTTSATTSKTAKASPRAVDASVTDAASTPSVTARRQEGATTGSHLVVFRAQDGSRQYLMTSDLDEAMIHAETLANERENDSSRIFELREVGIDYRTYYRVELRKSEPQIEAGTITEDRTPVDDDGQQPRVVVVSA
jgi:hypothetical protein